MRVQLAILFLFWPGLLWSQTDSASFRFFPEKDYFKSYYTDTRNLFSSVGQFDKQDWMLTGGIIAGGALLLTQDKGINRYWEEHSAPFADKAVKYGLEPFGLGVYPAAITGGLYLHATLKKNNYDRQVALTTVKAMIITSLVTQAGKQLFHRHRPLQENPGHWDGPIAPFRFRSFPSGHSSLAFSFASVMGHAYNDKPWVAVASYSAATLAAFARVYENKHYASDIFIGSLLGFYIGKSLWRMNEEKARVHMSLSSDGIGVQVALD